MVNILKIIGIICCISFSAFSQDNAVDAKDVDSVQHREIETLFKINRGFGGFIGLNTRYTEINGTEALLVGGEINMVIGHSLNFGLQGFGLVNPVKTSLSSEVDSNSFLNLGYGGFNIEPVFFSRKLVHFSIPIFVGVGGVVQTKRSYLDIEVDSEVWNKSDYIDNDFFLVAEPGLQVELNVFKWMRLGVGASYRFTGGVEQPNLVVTDLNGFSANMNIRLGWF